MFIACFYESGSENSHVHLHSIALLLLNVSHDVTGKQSKV